MDIDDLSKEQKAAVRALQRLGKKWPDGIQLTIFEEMLHITDRKGDLVIPIPSITAEQAFEPEDIPAGRLWDYEFIMTRLGSTSQRQTAVTETAFSLFQRNAAQAGLILTDITRRPHLPSEKVH